IGAFGLRVPLAELLQPRVDLVRDRLDVRSRESGDDDEIARDLDVLVDVVDGDVDALLGFREMRREGGELLGFDERSPAFVGVRPRFYSSGLDSDEPPEDPV